MSMPKARQKYPGYDPECFGREVCAVREALGLSQKELAQRANIHQGDKRTLRRIEDGHYSVAPEVRQALLSALRHVATEQGLRDDLEDLQRLAGLPLADAIPGAATTLNRREFAATVTPVLLDLGGSFQRRGRLSYDEALDALERPTLYVHVTRDLVRNDVDLLRDAARIESERLMPYVQGRYVGQGKEEATRAIARWFILVAASYQEDDQEEMDGVRAAMAAQRLARELQDRFLEQLGCWYEGVLRRKWAHERKGDSQGLPRARTLQEALVASPSSPTIEAFAWVERAKIAMAAGEGDAVVDDALSQGKQAARAAILAAQQGIDEAEDWLPAFAEHVHTVVWDGALRGYATFGRTDRDELADIITQATRFDDGLSFNIRHITLPLGEAAALWRLDDPQAHPRALQRWWEGQQRAQETNQRQQVIRGQKMIWRDQEVQRKLPQDMQVWCARCQDFTISRRQGPRGATYRCRESRNGRPCDYVTINLGSAGK